MKIYSSEYLDSAHKCAKLDRFAGKDLWIKVDFRTTYHLVPYPRHHHNIKTAWIKVLERIVKNNSLYYKIYIIEDPVEFNYYDLSLRNAYYAKAKDIACKTEYTAPPYDIQLPVSPDVFTTDELFPIIEE